MKILLSAFAILFHFATPLFSAEFRNVECEGTYPHHLQGVCTDGEAIYWSFTTTLVKTDLDGKLLKKVPVANHHGDLCFADGKLFVAVNLGKFNDPKGNADSWVYEYDAATLKERKRHETQEVFHGAGGIGIREGHFFVVGGLPADIDKNFVYEYDSSFQFIKKHAVKSGQTRLGIQTATFSHDRWWFGCYGNPKILLVTDADFQMQGRYEFDCSLGVEGLPDGRLLVARGHCDRAKGCSGSVAIAKPDSKAGLVVTKTAPVSFEKENDRLRVVINDQTVAEYVWQDEPIQRPYFRHLKTTSGIQVTRTHPPKKGDDLDDHPTMHPGLWLAFGDIEGHDFWRNKANVRHDRFLQEPKSEDGTGSFTVLNLYETDDKTICSEDCRITIEPHADGYLIRWSSTFRSETGEFAFGDQEEMGLGIRVATPLAVVKGGMIEDSEGRKNGAEVWGKQADWCEYRGTIDGRRVGLVLMPGKENFRRSWFHARDYGLLLANPFGRNAFTKGEKSRVTVKQEEKLRLEFGVLVYEVPAGKSLDIEKAYLDYVEK